MTKDELVCRLNELRGLPVEREVFEFKEAKNGFDFNKPGNYFSFCNAPTPGGVLRL